MAPNSEDLEQSGGQPLGDDESEMTVAVPRFNEEAEQTARPVVPLGQVDDAAVSAAHTRRPKAASRFGLAALPRGLALVLAMAGGVALGAVAVYLSTRQATSPAAIQVPEEEASTGALPEPSPTRPRTVDAPGTAPPTTSDPEARGIAASREESEKHDREDGQHRDRDKDKSQEQARKQEERRRRDDEKQAERERKEVERERKEAKKIAERRRDAEKGEERKARLVDTLTGRP